MNCYLRRREQHEVTSATPDLREEGRIPASKHIAAEALVEELSELVRDLHTLLESYAPQWYTKQMDARVNEMLARTACALGKTQQGSRQSRGS